MVFFAVSEEGVSSFHEIWQSNTVHQLWVGSGVLSQHQIDELRSMNISVTVFAHPINRADLDALAHAIATIQEHHPSEKLWIEG